MRYSIRISNYPIRIALSNLTRMMCVVDHLAICVEILKIDSGCFLDKEFNELIRMNINELSIKLIHVTIMSVVLEDKCVVKIRSSAHGI